ncbi:MAG: putative sulfate exporter family transporter [Verrucomicrobiales bacterium]|nr:putative sulfate exporter family transporter [Verrucomicrobiales bacterium]
MPTQPIRPYNVYLASETTGSLDSFEGVPDFASLPQSDEAALRFGWQKKLHRALDSASALAPGLILASLIAVVATFLAGWFGTSILGYAKSPVSPILVTVLLGLALRNAIGLPAKYRDGLNWCVKRLLRIGVALLGLRLSIAAVSEIGLHALPVVLGCILAAILGVIGLGKLTGLSLKLSTLIAVGTSICGVSAIVATGPAIKADDDEISYSVAVITLFGMIALTTYPFLAHFLFAGNEVMAGLFLGTSIHDTSQVAGAGLMYQMTYDSPKTLDVAATTKLVRNLCLGLVIPVVAIIHNRRSGDAGKTGRLPFSKWVPGFVLAFLACVVIRSLGDLGDDPFFVLSPDQWQSALHFSQSASLFFLTLALAAIGLGTSFAQIRELGWRPLVIGFASAALVGLVSFGLITLLFDPTESV